MAIKQYGQANYLSGVRVTCLTTPRTANLKLLSTILYLVT